MKKTRDYKYKKIFLITFLALMLISILILERIARAEYSAFADEIEVESVEFNDCDENSISLKVTK